jgi:hypothetical protein
MVAHHTVKKLRHLRKGLAKAESAVEVFRARIVAAKLAVRRHAIDEGLATDSDSGSSSSSSDSDDEAEDVAAGAGSSHEGVVPALGIEDAPELPPAEPILKVTERALALLAEPGLAHAAVMPPPKGGSRPEGQCMACWMRATKRAGGPKHAYDLTCVLSSPRVRRVL